MILIPGLAAGLSNGFGAQLGVGSAARGAFSVLRLRSMLRLRAK
jgi:type IV secretion system protein VirB6